MEKTGTERMRKCFALCFQKLIHTFWPKVKSNNICFESMTLEIFVIYVANGFWTKCVVFVSQIIVKVFRFKWGNALKKK